MLSLIVSVFVCIIYFVFFLLQICLSLLLYFDFWSMDAVLKLRQLRQDMPADVMCENFYRETTN